MGACHDFCVGFAKCIVIFFNVLILISAISLIVTAAVYRNQAGSFDVSGVSTFAIILGVLIGVIAFFGCCGAIKENSCMLTLYAGILLVFFIIQVILAIVAFVAASNEDRAIENRIALELGSLYNNTEDKARTTINDIQTGLECCGLYGPNGTEVNNSTGIIMKSCCPLSVSACTTTKAYQIGCVTELTEIVLASLYVTGFVAVFFAIIELAGALFAFCIRGDINKDRLRFA